MFCYGNANVMIRPFQNVVSCPDVLTNLMQGENLLSLFITINDLKMAVILHAENSASHRWYVSAAGVHTKAIARNTLS